MSATHDIFGNNAVTIAGGVKLNGKALAAFGAAAYKVGGSEQGAPASITGSEWNWTGMLLQNFNITYQQQVTKLRALDTLNVFLVIAPPTGQLQLQYGVMGSSGFIAFTETFGDACKTDQNNIQLLAFQSNCGDSMQAARTAAGNTTTTFNENLPKITLKGCAISQLSLTQNIENLTLMSNLTLEFVEMYKPEEAPNTGPEPIGPGGTVPTSPG